MTGKLADSVMTVRNGVQIARKYQPVVNNPQTPAQLAARAKMKLLSQLSAAVAPVIAMPKQGPVSSRNLFTKKNYEFTQYDGSQAVIPMADILLTNSTAGLPGFTVERSVTDGMEVKLEFDASKAWDRMVYVVLSKTSSQQIIPAGVSVVSEAGSDGRFTATMPNVSGDIAVLAYGVRLRSSAARVVFGNLIAPTAFDYAAVIVSRQLTENDMVLSETRGAYLSEEDNTGSTTGVPSIVVSSIVIDQGATPQPGWGSVSGTGTYPQGTTVTLTATPNEGYRFVGWWDGANLDPTNPLIFSAETTKRLYAMMEQDE